MKLLYALPVEHGLLDSLGKPSLIGIYSRIDSTELPIDLQELKVGVGFVAEPLDAQRSVGIDVAIVDPDGKILDRQALSFDIDDEQPANSVLHLGVVFKDVRFIETGVHSIRVAISGHEIGDTALTIATSAANGS